MRNTVMVLVVVMICVGCTEKDQQAMKCVYILEDQLSLLTDEFEAWKNHLKIMENLEAKKVEETQDKDCDSNATELRKSYTAKELEGIYHSDPALCRLAKDLYGVGEGRVKWVEPYDPNVPELQFLIPTDPNWARDYGDNERTRIILNVSANRGMSLNNRNVLAEVAKRLIAMEARFDPNEVKE